MSQTVTSTTNTQSSTRIFTGREQFLTSLRSEDITKDNVIAFVSEFYQKFLPQKSDIEYLLNYDKGDQPIKSKVRDVLSEANNIVIVNLARTGRKSIQAAFLGQATQYLPTEESDALKNALKKITSVYREEDEAAHNLDIEDFRGICGVAYEFVGKDSVSDFDFSLKTLDPNLSFMVKNSGMKQEKVLFDTFYAYNDPSTNKHVGTYHLVYTNKLIFEFVLKENGTETFKIPDKSGKKVDIIVSNNPLGDIPVVEYINNRERMGDFEAAITILDAINSLYSKRIDNIDDLVDALIVFVNTTIYEKKIVDGKEIWDDTKLKLMKKNKAVEILGEPGLPADIKHIVNKLDQENVQVVVDNLTALAYAVMGVPNGVNAKTSGGGDTGEAANTREGWKAFEHMLNIKERHFRKALKNRMKIIQRLNKFDKEMVEFDVAKTNIKFVRSKELNSQAFAQALKTLEDTGLFSAETLIALSNIVDDPSAEVKKVIDNLKSLKEQGVLNEMQYNIALTQFYVPNANLEVMFPKETTKQ